MIPDKESWCDSLIPIVILEAIDVIRNQLRTPRVSNCVRSCIVRSYVWPRFYSTFKVNIRTNNAIKHFLKLLPIMNLLH